MRRWQLTEHISHMNDILLCSDRCHEMMTTDGAWFVPKVWLTMLCPLSWEDENWRSMFYTWMIYYNALTVVMRRWQLTEHIPHMNDILLCSDLFHEMMTIDGAWFVPKVWITLLCPLSWDNENWRSMFHTWMIYSMLWPLSSHDEDWRSIFHTLWKNNHALTVVMRRWQLVEHDSYLRDI